MSGLDELVVREVAGVEMIGPKRRHFPVLIGFDHATGGESR